MDEGLLELDRTVVAAADVQPQRRGADGALVRTRGVRQGRPHSGGQAHGCQRHHHGRESTWMSQDLSPSRRNRRRVIRAA
ncbi:MAG: hypothetical protein WAV00_15490, partial [Nocardioides sp.]